MNTNAVAKTKGDRILGCIRSTILSIRNFPGKLMRQAECLMFHCAFVLLDGFVWKCSLGAAIFAQRRRASAAGATRFELKRPTGYLHLFSFGEPKSHLECVG